MKKEYKCCKCGKVLVDYKPSRYVKQFYNTDTGYKQYKNIKHYDLCKVCNMKLKKWLEGGN